MPRKAAKSTEHRLNLGALGFLEAAANWADRERVDVIFLRDDGDWCALIRMSDSRGAFQTEVDFMPSEKDEEFCIYARRVSAALSRAYLIAKEARPPILSQSLHSFSFMRAA